MAGKTAIHLRWDTAGAIQHSVTGAILPPPRDNQTNWILAPSAPFLLAHQFGSMKPCHSMIVSGWVLDILFHNRYVLMPINSALKAARIEFLYPGGPSIKIQFHPQHTMFANSDSIEEGVRQLINNYTKFVYAQLDDYPKIVVRTSFVAAISAYQDHLQELVASGRHDRIRDVWTPGISMFSAWLLNILSQKFYMPEGGRNPDNEDWAEKQTAFLEESYSKIMSSRDSLLMALGMY